MPADSTKDIEKPNEDHDPNRFDSEGYAYTGFNEVGLDRHDFDRNGKLFDPTEFGDQEDPEESARLAEVLFEAGLLYERDGFNTGAQE